MRRWDDFCGAGSRFAVNDVVAGNSVTRQVDDARRGFADVAPMDVRALFAAFLFVECARSARPMVRQVLSGRARPACAGSALIQDR